MTIQAIQLTIYSSLFVILYSFLPVMPAHEVKGRQGGREAGRQGGRQACRDGRQARVYGKPEAADRKLVVPLFVGRMEATRVIGRVASYYFWIRSVP
jgi:hypothetical protein